MTLHPDEITLTARVMTDVEPSAGLEERIKQRLYEEAQSRPAITRWPLIASVATAVATVALTFALRSPEVPESRSPDVAQSRSHELLGTPANVIVDPIADRAKTRPLGTAGPRDSGTSSGRIEAELAWLSRRIPALDVIDPLAVDRLTFESIQPEAMSITPLTMTPLVTSPPTGAPDSGRQFD